MGDADINWQNKLSGLSARLQWMAKEYLHTDVHFTVGCNEIVYFSSHKLILAAGSPVFESMFYGKSYSLNFESEVYIEVEDVDPTGFRTMLKYLYDESVLFHNHYEAFQTMFAARKYKINNLIEKCSEYVSTIIPTAENVFEALEFSRFLELYDLEEKCILFLEENATDCFKGKTFYAAGLETVISVLKLPLLRIPEADLLSFAISWLRNLDESKIADYLQLIGYSLLANIHFLSVGAEHFCKFLDENQDILTYEDKMAVLKHLKNPQASPLPPWCCSDSCRVCVTENVPIGLVDDGSKQFTSVVSWFECKYEVTIKNPVYRDVQSMTLVWCNRREDLPLQMDVTVIWNDVACKTKKVRKTKQDQEIVFEFNRKTMLPGKSQKLTVRVDFKQPAPICFFQPIESNKYLIECSLLSAFAMNPSKRKIVFNKAYCVKNICMICYTSGHWSSQNQPPGGGL